MALRLVALAAVVLVIACGPPSAAPPTTPTTLIAIGTPAGSMQLVDLTGRVVASARETIAVSSVQGVGGLRVVYLDASLEPGQTATSWTLKALGRDGTVETLQRFGTKAPRGIVVSPNGHQWLWTEVTDTYDGGWRRHSALHLASSDGTDRVIARFDPPGNGTEIVQAYRWDAGGAIVSHSEMSSSEFAFLGLGALGDTYLLDPVTLTLTPLSAYEYSGPPGQCNIQARAPDGTLACISQYPNPTADPENWRSELRIDKPSNTSLVIQLDSTHMRLGAGAVAFAPGPKATKLVLGEWNGTKRPVTGPVSPWYVTDCRTDLVDLTRGDVRSPFGPDGLCPPNGGWAWIDDLNMIAFSPATTSTYVVSSIGVARRLASGIPVGIVRG